MTPQRAVGVTDVASGAGVVDYRTRERVAGGVTVVEQYLIDGLLDRGVLSFVGAAATFRTTAALNMTSLSNAAGSGVLVAVRSLVMAGTNTVNSGTTRMLNLYQQAAIPTGGVDMSKVSLGTGEDSAQTSSASVVVKATTSADGGAVTAISLTLGSRVRSALVPRTPDAALSGQNGGVWTEYLNPRVEPVILRPGESLAVSAEAATSGASMAFAWTWDEYVVA